MDLNADKPIFLGVCHYYAKGFNINVETARILAVIFMLFTGFGFPLYVILGLLKNPNAVQNVIKKEEKPKDNEVIINGVRDSQGVVINGVCGYEDE